MICFPNCKINFGLSVLNKRPDGFHNVETIFYPLKLNDILEIVLAPDRQLSFTLTGLKIDGAKENNLVLKAYKLLNSSYQIPPVKIHLHKVIPPGAGLGGGSSDAAFTIKSLNKLFNLGMSSAVMQDYASKLGADCAFFIENKPVIATETGNRLKPIYLTLQNYFFMLVKPAIHIGTPEAYSWIKPQPKNTHLQDTIIQPVTYWQKHLKNDFESVVFDRYPEIKLIKDTLYKMGALYASLSGSGSAVYGIFNNPVPSGKEFKHCFTWSGTGL
jgi:4-diphosphocytidyl-2-C-methyl-D-erythritol kinase